MPKLQEQYDVVIIGSGLGGLLCGYMLAKEGKSVCILEKNAQIGGNLQTFKRDGVKFDSGVHYIGGLDPGQALHPFFGYFNLQEFVEKEALDVDGYDLISFAGDPNLYPHAQGYENFIRRLLHFFPEEEEGIRKYCQAIQEICGKFEWYNLGQDLSDSQETETYGIGARDVITKCTQNPKLQQVLAGSNLLYAGEGDSSPFYIHALITDSYIRSAYKLNYSDQISKHLRKDIRGFGGHIFINSEVVKIQNDSKKVIGVELATGKTVKAEQFISNIHPSLTFRMLNPEGLRKVSLKRMLELENTISSFILYIKLKPETFPFLNANRYHYFDEDVWNTQHYDQKNWLKAIGIFNSRKDKKSPFSDTMTVMAYMDFAEVRAWENTENTTLNESERAKDYQEFKEKKSQEILEAMEKIYPDFRNQVASYYSATPLTQRDYIGSVEGGLYGIKRDFRSPLSSFVGTKTKLENLFLTGQNVILHGVLGVSISAAVTCQAILGRDLVMSKFREFYQDPGKQH